MKVMEKSRGVKQNGSMAYRQKRTYWSARGGHSSSSVHGGVCARKILKEEKTTTTTEKHRPHADSQQRFEICKGE